MNTKYTENIICVFTDSTRMFTSRNQISRNDECGWAYGEI